MKTNNESFFPKILEWENFQGVSFEDSVILCENKDIKAVFREDKATV